MELFLQLWTAAPDLKIRLLVLALCAQMMISAVAYIRMSRARVGAHKEGRISPDTYKAVGHSEPEDLRVYTRAVANQFEAPVMFYAVVLAGLAIGVSSWLTVILAFLYVVFRWVHLNEMTRENQVFKRRKIFIQSIRVLLVMMAELLVSTFFFA